MTDIDADSGRDFHGLDARQAQAALAEELVNETEAQAVSSDVSDENEDKSDATPAGPLWSDAELAEHVRMAEALLFAAAEPLDEESIAERLPVGADIATIIARITEDYENRGVHLQKTDKKWRFVTAGDVAHVLEKEKVTPRRLSRAALETLAIIAYHQPCTRADIEDVRGVAVSKGSLDQLLEIGWARLRGKRRDVPGRPTLYGTTEAFLEHFSLETIQDLPGLADLKAAGLLDARLPPGFSVPAPSDADDEEGVEDGEDAEFAQDFLSEEEDIRSDEDGETVDA
jgi:segregation and condensation protein B